LKAVLLASIAAVFALTKELTVAIPAVFVATPAAFVATPAVFVAVAAAFATI
jgi:hypothetical protein